MNEGEASCTDERTLYQISNAKASSNVQEFLATGLLEECPFYYDGRKGQRKKVVKSQNFNMNSILPRPFCTAHLPIVDTIMVMETETGERYETKYLPRLGRLSGGWSMFVKKMKLKEGDAVVLNLPNSSCSSVCVAVSAIGFWQSSATSSSRLLSVWCSQPCCCCVLMSWLSFCATAVAAVSFGAAAVAFVLV